MSETTVRKCDNFGCDHNEHKVVMIHNTVCFDNGKCALKEISLKYVDRMAFCAEATDI